MSHMIWCGDLIEGHFDSTNSSHLIALCFFLFFLMLLLKWLHLLWEEREKISWIIQSSIFKEPFIGYCFCIARTWECVCFQCYTTFFIIHTHVRFAYILNKKSKLLKITLFMSSYQKVVNFNFTFLCKICAILTFISNNFLTVFTC